MWIEPIKQFCVVTCFRTFNGRRTCEAWDKMPVSILSKYYMGSKGDKMTVINNIIDRIRKGTLTLKDAECLLADKNNDLFHESLRNMSNMIHGDIRSKVDENTYKPTYHAQDLGNLWAFSIYYARERSGKKDLKVDISQDIALICDPPFERLFNLEEGKKNNYCGISEIKKFAAGQLVKLGLSVDAKRMAESINIGDPEREAALALVAKG